MGAHVSVLFAQQLPSVSDREPADYGYRLLPQNVRNSQVVLLIKPAYRMVVGIDLPA